MQAKNEKIISFTVIDVINNYYITINGPYTFVNIEQYKQKYMVVTDIEGMGNQIKCHLCNIIIPTNIGSIIIGNGKILGIIICRMCGTACICEFEGKSLQQIKKDLKITEEAMNQDWKEIDATTKFH